MNNPYIYNVGLHFNEIAEHFAQNTALKLISGDEVTYQITNEKSNQIAHYFLSLGVKIGDIIAIVHDKSPMPYYIMLACLKIGATYTNLDSNSPEERHKKMIGITNPKYIFTNSTFLTKFQKYQLSIPIRNYQDVEFENSIKDESKTLPEVCHHVTGNKPAYLMFTSGSTGFPKAVIISHANVLNFIAWTKLIYKTTENDIFTNINPMYFDNSVFDFYASLFTGATLIPITEDLNKNPRKLIEQLNILKPTIWFSVPSMLVYVLKLRALKETDLPNLRIITFGGEGFPKNQLRNLWSILGHRVEIVNVYGPTECTCICSSYVVKAEDMTSDDLLPLGPIAPNFNQLIIKEDNSIANEDEIGELLITGSNVGLGYYNLPEKTKEMFIQNPTIKTHQEIVYRSGDLVKFSKDKNLLYFCGRKDNQIKRMGYRIELEEIEVAIGALEYVVENAAIYQKTDDNNGTIIVCLVSKHENENQILTDLQNIIPSYMLPNVFKFFKELPKNQNGKIDRIQLKSILNE